MAPPACETSAISSNVRAQQPCRVRCSTMPSGRAPRATRDRTGRYDRDAVPDPAPATRSIAATSDRPVDGARPDVVAEPDLTRAVLDTVIEAVVVFDPDTWLIGEVNRGACELTGRSADDLVGRAIQSTCSRRPRRLVSSRSSGPWSRAGRTIARTMMDIRRPDGQTTSVEVVLQSVQLPGGSRAIVADRPRHPRPDRGPGPAPAPGRGRACPGGRAQRRHPGDGRGGRRVRRSDGTITLDQSGRRAALPGRRGADLRRDPATSSHDPDGSGAAPRRSRAARSSCRPRDDPGSLDRARRPTRSRRRRPGDRRRRDDRGDARRDRGSPARGRPRDVHRRPVARAADAGDDDLRRREAARPRELDARRGDQARASSATSTRRPSACSGWSRTSSP